MAGQHHRCNEHELGQTPGDGEGQGGLVCYSPWGHKESDMTGRLNNNSIEASMVAQRLKCLPAMQETWVQSLVREDPLEKEMATNSSILVWRIPCTEEPGGLQSMEPQKSWTHLTTKQQQFFLSVVYEKILIQFPVLYSRSLLYI